MRSIMPLTAHQNGGYNDIPVHPKVKQRHPKMTERHPRMSQARPKMAHRHPEMTQGHPEMSERLPEMVNRLSKMVNLHPEIGNRIKISGYEGIVISIDLRYAELDTEGNYAGTSKKI